MRKVFKKSLGFILFLIVIAIGLLYLYSRNHSFFFNEGDIKLSSNLSVNYEDGSKLNIIGSKKTKVSVINLSDEKVTYFIEFKNIKKSNDVSYEISDKKDFKKSGDLKNTNSVIASNIEIDAGETTEYTINFESDKNSKYSLEINVSTANVNNKLFVDTILDNNKVKNKPLTTVGKDIAIKNEGLIKSEDDFGTTYYFRGKVKNNNVMINNLNFKIVRINGDGSVKIILDSVAKDVKKYYENINNYHYKDSSINNYLNSWLNESLADYKQYIANQKYCDDTSLKNDTFYSLERIVDNNLPSFICLGKLTKSKVGLLTVDEAVYAGATINNDNTSFYLYNKNITNDYFLLGGAYKKDNSYIPFSLSSGGKIRTDVSGDTVLNPRPVITLSKSVTVTGTGTIDDPYVLTQ